MHGVLGAICNSMKPLLVKRPEVSEIDSFCYNALDLSQEDVFTFSPPRHAATGGWVMTCRLNWSAGTKSMPHPDSTPAKQPKRKHEARSSLLVRGLYTDWIGSLSKVH